MVGTVSRFSTTVNEKKAEGEGVEPITFPLPWFSRPVADRPAAPSEGDGGGGSRTLAAFRPATPQQGDTLPLCHPSEMGDDDERLLCGMTKAPERSVRKR